MKLSLIVPCYNEAENVQAFQDAVISAFNGCNYDYELVYVDDGSKDNTLGCLKKLAEDSSKLSGGDVKCVEDPYGFMDVIVNHELVNYGSIYFCAHGNVDETGNHYMGVYDNTDEYDWKRFYEKYDNLISSYLDTADIPDPDLMIRTSGEQRLSNFLMWQLAYTEFYFTDVPWPAFDKAELEKAVEKYNGRDRRYGGVKEE